MAHFAQLDEDNIVLQVIVSPDWADEITMSQESGETWKKTSYNTFGGVWYDPDTGIPPDDQSKAFRKNYAGIGFTYDPVRDAFIPPQPFRCWILDEISCLWKPSVPYPADYFQFSGQYRWDEDNCIWVIDTPETKVRTV